MAHPLLLRIALVSGFQFEPVRTEVPAWISQVAVQRMMKVLNAWTAPGYRPERHYMRGGRTPGAKSLSAR